MGLDSININSLNQSTLIQGKIGKRGRSKKKTNEVMLVGSNTGSLGGNQEEEARKLGPWQKSWESEHQMNKKLLMN